MEREIAKYDNWPVERAFNLDVLQYWRNREHEVPLLALTVRHLLGIPASTAQLERLFSAAGRAITRRRPKLKASRASDLIYGHANVVRGLVP